MPDLGWLASCQDCVQSFGGPQGCRSIVNQLLIPYIMIHAGCASHSPQPCNEQPVDVQHVVRLARSHSQMHSAASSWQVVKSCCHPYMVQTLANRLQQPCCSLFHLRIPSRPFDSVACTPGQKNTNDLAHLQQWIGPVNGALMLPLQNCNSGSSQPCTCRAASPKSNEMIDSCCACTAPQTQKDCAESIFSGQSF